MTTPAEWRQRAEEYDAKAKKALEAGDQKEALVWVRATWAARDAAEEMERLEAERATRRRKRLPRAGAESTVNTVMTSAHKVAISAGRSSPRNKLAAAARASGITVRELARRVGVSNSLLTMAAQGERSIRRDVAEQIEKLTGFPVSSWRKLS